MYDWIKLDAILCCCWVFKLNWQILLGLELQVEELSWLFSHQWGKNCLTIEEKIYLKIQSLNVRILGVQLEFCRKGGGGGVETLFGRMPFEHAVSFNTWFFPNCFCKFDYISTAVIICHLWLFFERHFAYFSDWIQRFFFRYLFSQQEKVTGARQLSF